MCEIFLHIIRREHNSQDICVKDIYELDTHQKKSNSYGIDWKMNKTVNYVFWTSRDDVNTYTDKTK